MSFRTEGSKFCLKWNKNCYPACWMGVRLARSLSKIHLLQFSSSELSLQSFWLSHRQWSGIQLLFLHWNSWGPQVFLSEMKETQFLWLASIKTSLQYSNCYVNAWYITTQEPWFSYWLRSIPRGEWAEVLSPLDLLHLFHVTIG